MPPAEQRIANEVGSLEQIVPVETSIARHSLYMLLQKARAEGRRLPFSADSIAFCDHLSRLIFADEQAKSVPELTALAYFLRKASLQALKQSFAQDSPNTMRVPRGLVFHIPPRNVETITIYSWAFSFLCGNANVIRVSPQASLQTRLLCELLREALKDASPAVRMSTIVLAYGHEDEITSDIGINANMRVIWGGDATINAVRAVALPPDAHELTFYDRNSLSVLNAAAFLALGVAAKADLCKNFFNDVYMFDQLTCSSPRLLVWVASSTSEFTAARTEFQHGLKTTIEHEHYTVAPAQSLEKLAYMFSSALEQPVSAHTGVGNELSFLTLDSLDLFAKPHSAEAQQPFCGSGLLFEYHAGALSDISSAIATSCQTMTHFGFPADQLRELAAMLQGRGIDRMVPVGQALQFNRYWDGYDLLAEFTKVVYVEA